VGSSTVTRAGRFALLLALALGGVHAAAGGEAGMKWHRRSLRRPSPQGYIAVITLASSGADGGEAILDCATEGLKLRAGGGRWAVTKGDETLRSGKLPGGSTPASFFVKRTPRRLLVGANGQWLYGQAVPATDERARVALGVAGHVRMKSFRLVAREPVRFDDDFPDPVSRLHNWSPVRGQWALSSVTYYDKSANPAELAAIFDKLDDVASRGRTREYAIGIGVRFGGGFLPQITVVANDSPAERAGLAPGDIIRQVDGVRVRTIADAAARLRGEAGKPVALLVERRGKERKVKLTREVVVWGKTRRQVPLMPFCEDRVALITTGYDFWTDYHFRAAVHAQNPGAVGLVFAYLGPDDYHVFRWLGADKVLNHSGRWLLERVRGGRRTVLATRDGGFHPYDFFALGVEIEGDELGKIKATCYVDAEPVLSARDDALVPGRIGLWAEAPGVACFDDVEVGEAATARRTSAGTRNPQQLADPTMRHWANPSYQWHYTGIQYWHKAPFPGDVTIACPVPRDQKLVLTVSASKHGAETGYTFTLPEEQGPALLQRAGKTVATAAKFNRQAKRAALARQGNRIAALLDGEPCLEFTDPQPLRGKLVGAAGVLPADISAASPNVVEDYFNGCPTDWHVLDGQWEVMNRWVCNPTWSFFGGRNDDGLLAIWNKRRLEGDYCSVETDVSVMMMSRTGRYENMRDVGLSLCAENQDLASGYAVIVGAYGNQRTILYRKGRIVASTARTSALLPTQRGYSRSTELYSQHRGWSHIRLEKDGRTVRVYVWGKLALSYRDPEPLPGGHAAIWSIHNGIMVAKVRLAATRLALPTPVLRHHPVYADAVLTNDCADGNTAVAFDGAQYEITNTASGGPFALAFRPRVFSAFDHPKLSFDIKLTPQAKVDLYFTCQSTHYRVPLSGPRDARFQGVTLPAPEGVKADGKWHRVAVDLLGILRRRHSGDKLLMVLEPVLANYSNQGYLLAGFGGNGAGARYWLRNVAFAPPAHNVPQLTRRH